VNFQSFFQDAGVHVCGRWRSLFEAKMSEVKRSEKFEAKISEKKRKKRSEIL
jgi:hypothetical protein